MRKKKRDHNEIDYWQSNTDLMTALVLVLLLIVMLLVLYLMEIPEHDQPDPHIGANYNVDDRIGDDDGHYYQSDDDDGHGGGGGGGEQEDEEEEGDEEDDGNGGGGSGTGIGTDPQYNYEFPWPTNNGEDWRKAAVYATVVDAETGRAIRKEGITFELYEEQIENDGGALRFLNTYYPVKTEYRNYETTEEGVFYLPEKIEEGYYYFKQITELEGYDLSGTVHFELDDIYEWTDPYVVSIEVAPSKNIIPIQIEDMETHEPLTDGTFQIIAAEDIITADNSLRYAKDTTADTVTFDKNGHGQSKELYLGKYTVVQGKIPRYYVGIINTESVQVEKKDGSTPQTLKYLCEKTKIRVKLTDNLYTGKRLEGAEFSLRCETNPELSKTAVTDENGEIVFTDLEKNALYTLTELSAPEGYKFNNDALKIYVDEYGKIEDAAETSCELTNYIARVSVNVEDKLFGKPISELTMALYNSAGEKINTWMSNGTEKIFENLPEGGYYVLVNGNKDKKYEFEASDDVELLDVTITIMTVQDVGFIAAGCLIAALGIGGISSIIIKKRKRVHSEEAEEPAAK